MKKSLQAIEDYYYSKGLRGSALRKATQNDKEYIRFLRERWVKLTKKFEVTSRDRKRYVLSTDQDYEILGKIYDLEHQKLSKHDRELIWLIRTQLEHHWRTPIIGFLNKLANKYK